MDRIYTNNPTSIGKYFSNSNLIMSYTNRQFPFDSKLETNINIERKNESVLEIKPRTSVPDQQQSIGTQIPKSCNLPGITINRFENPHDNIQDPVHIIQDETFRGGVPSRSVMKDIYFNNHKSIYKK